MAPTLRLPRGFDRDLKLILVAMFTRRIVMGFLGVVRAIYFSLIGLSPVAIGLLMTIGTAVGALEALFFGTLSDKYGRKPFLILGAIFSMMRLILYALSGDFWVLALAQGLGALGEGAGAGQPVVSGYIADKTKAEDRSSIFSTLAITNAISATMGSLMASLPAYFQLNLGLNMVSSHTLLFWIGAALSFLALVVLLPLKEAESRERVDDVVVLPEVSWRDIGRYSLVRSTSGLAMGLVSPLLPLYFYLRFGIGSEDLAPVYALARFLPIFTYFFVPIFTKRFGDIRTLVATRILTSIFLVAFAFAPTFQISSALFITYRLLSQFSIPMRQSFAAGIVKPSRTGAIIGISGFARSSIRSIAPTITGYLFQFASLTTPLLFGSVLMGVNGLLYHAFYGVKEGGAERGST